MTPSLSKRYLIDKARRLVSQHLFVANYVPYLFLWRIADRDTQETSSVAPAVGMTAMAGDTRRQGQGHDTERVLTAALPSCRRDPDPDPRRLLQL